MKFEIEVSADLVYVIRQEYGQTLGRVRVRTDIGQW